MIKRKEQRGMAECKHEMQWLMGTADGITCRKCGKQFKSFEEIEAENKPAAEPEEPKAAEKPAKKPGKGKTK